MLILLLTQVLKSQMFKESALLVEKRPLKPTFSKLAKVGILFAFYKTNILRVAGLLKVVKLSYCYLRKGEFLKERTLLRKKRVLKPTLVG